jgi:hypothetical protein
VTRTVTKISAIGTRGKAKGKLFVAKKDSSGRYVLNKKTSSNSIDPTNKAVNKIFASSLTEAANLLETNDYLINLVDEEGTRALREFKKVKIEYVEA